MALCRLRAAGARTWWPTSRAWGTALAQMCLGFGADELFGPIVAERALRLGANASNPAMTRKEAATLIRGAGLRPASALAGGALRGGARHEPQLAAHPRQGARRGEPLR